MSKPVVFSQDLDNLLPQHLDVLAVHAEIKQELGHGNDGGRAGTEIRHHQSLDGDLVAIAFGNAAVHEVLQEVLWLLIVRILFEDATLLDEGDEHLSGLAKCGVNTP